MERSKKDYVVSLLSNLGDSIPNIHDSPGHLVNCPFNSFSFIAFVSKRFNRVADPRAAREDFRQTTWRMRRIQG